MIQRVKVSGIRPAKFLYECDERKEWMDGWMDGWMNGWMDIWGWTENG